MQRLTGLSLAHPLAALALLAAATGGLAAGALRLETDVGYRAILGRAHPTVARFDAFLQRFGGGFPLVAVYRCGADAPCASALDPAALRMDAAVEAALAGVPSVRRVVSPASAPLLVPGDEGPELRRLMEHGEPARDLAWLSERALRDSLWPRQLVSEDGRAGAIALEVASSSSADNAAAYAALDAALAPQEAAGWRFARVGGPVEFVVAGGELQADTARLVPVMVVLVGAVLYALFRSLAVAAATLVTAGGGVVFCFGLMGWLGWPQNSVTQALPPLLLVIGICDGIHLMSRYAIEAGEHPERGRSEILVGVARDIGTPCIGTSVTTAAGFASFATSDLESFARFGIAAAFGVMAALLLTFTWLPIAAARIRPDGIRALRASEAWDRVLRRVVHVSETHARPIFAATVLSLGVFAVGFSQLRVDASFEDLYGEHSRVVRWAHEVADALRKPDSLEVELTAPPGAAVDDPGTLRVVASVADSLAGVEALGPARSVVDLVRLVDQLASDDEPFWYRIPGRADDVREIYDEVRRRDAAQLTRWLDAPERVFRVSLEASKPPQDVMRRIFSEVHRRLAAELPPGWSAQETGPLAVVHEMIDEIQRTQLESFATAALVVWALAALFLRSLRLSMLALVPTLLPVIATLGAMGLVGTSLDVGSAMVAAVVLGIAVDDALHLLSQYERRLAAGDDPPTAMNRAVLHVGRAVVTTSVALTLGFYALTLSSWRTISSFGALAAAAILLALFAVLLVLPALVSATWGRWAPRA
jgi:uncharacterized protein